MAVDKKARTGAVIERLPLNVKATVDDMIRRRKSAASIMKFLCNYTNRSFDVPDQRTIKAYVERKTKELFKSVDDKLEIDEMLDRTSRELDAMMKDLTSGQGSVEPLVLVDKITAILLERTMIIRRLNENMADPKYEKVITENMGALRAMLETKQKLEGRFGSSDQLVVEMIKLWMSEFAPMVRLSFEQVAGNDPVKVKKFLESIQNSVRGIDLNRIKRSAVVAVQAQEKAEKGGTSVDPSLRVIPA